MPFLVSKCIMFDMDPSNKSFSILKFPEVKIVEASAGSGKTYALARRYIQLLFSSGKISSQVSLRQILAITFTHKATREMRERILDLLKKIALKNFKSRDEERDLLVLTGLSIENSSEAAFQILDSIITNYNFFQVKNIDSFINVILSGCASELELSANFQIRENYSKYISFALDQSIEAVNDDLKTKLVFENFLNQYLFLEQKTGWFPKKDIYDVICGMFMQSNIYGCDFVKFDIEKNEVIILKRKIISLLNSIFEKQPEGMNKRFLNTTLYNFLKNNKNGFNLSDLDKKSFLSESPPYNKGAEIYSEETVLWADFRKTVVELSEKESLSLFNCYIDIFNIVYGNFRKNTRNDDIIFMEELNKQARFLFKYTDLDVPELYYRLASRLKHFLIDEFQDTSKLQWSNLFLMIEDALSSGGSLFYVGDKKQAIYRFRGGSVELFDGIKQELSHFNVNDKTVLRTNYRSQKEIVEFNNKVFSGKNLKRFLIDQQDSEKSSLKKFSEDDMGQIIDIFKDSKQQSLPDKSHGYVKVSYVDYDDKQDKEDKEERTRGLLLETIKNVRERFPLSSIAILCRSNKEIESVTGWLSEEKINVESERTLNILNNFLIKELIAFLKFLNSPIDSVAFSAFILGDIFSTACGILQDEFRGFIFKFNRNKKNETDEGYLYRSFKKAYPGIWDELISPVFKNIGFVSSYELIVSIIDRLKVYKNFGRYQGFFMRFLELVKEQERDNPSIELFLDHLQKIPESQLYVNFSDENAIKVMTIHKAKGLGFPVVIVPFLEMNIRDLGAKIQKARAPYIVYDKDADLEQYGLLRLDKKYAVFSERIKAIYRHEYKKAFIDELNVIYVTFTRASDELYVFVPRSDSKGINARNDAVFLITSESMVLGKPAVSAEMQKHDEHNLKVSLPEYKDWLSALKEEFGSEINLVNRRSVSKGRVLHQMLSCIGDLSESGLENALMRLERDFSPILESFALKEYIEIIRKLAITDNLRPFFYHSGKVEVFREKEFVDESGRTKRIDRLIVGKEKAVIVDYKSSKDNLESNTVQVQGYKQLLKRIYPDKEIKGFLLFTDIADIKEI